MKKIENEKDKGVGGRRSEIPMAVSEIAIDHS